MENVILEWHILIRPYTNCLLRHVLFFRDFNIFLYSGCSEVAFCKLSGTRKMSAVLFIYFSDKLLNCCLNSSNAVVNRISHYYQFWMNRSNRPELFCKKGVLKNFTKFTGQYLCQSLFLNKVLKNEDPGTCFFLWILWSF